MANKTITVLEADGVTETDVVSLDVGRQAAAASKSVAASTEDKAVLDAIAASLAIIDNITQPITEAQMTALMNSNGRADADDSDPVTFSNEDLAVLTAIETAAEALATGLTPFFSLDLDETEEEVKATAGRLYKIRITNRTTSIRYVKIYNATAASTTVGTTTPLDVFPVPAGESADKATVLTESYPDGLIFTTALSIACTTGFANNDTGAPGANDVIVSAYYK